MKKPHKFAGLIPPNLLRVIREGRCVLFVGAGLSAQAKTEDGKYLPVWSGLLEQMIDWCIENRIDLRANRAEFIEIIQKKRFLTVAQELQERLGPRLSACLSEILHAGKIRPSEAHKQIPKIPWVAILTSNYDSLVEGAYTLAYGGVVPPVFAQNNVGSALDCLRNNRHFVFKIHGDINIPESIILGNRDYARLLYLSPAYRSFLETVFATYTVLFIGFGGEDPDLNDITDKLSSVYERSIGQHFILIPNDAFSPIERRRLLEDKRLDCITYEKDDSHSQVVEFLKALAVRAKPDVPETPSPFKLEKLRPRVFISGSFKQVSFIRELAELAKEVGFEPWFAESEIKPGRDVQDFVSEAIVDTDWIVVVITKDSARSPWVIHELGRAWAAQKQILAIRIGDAPIPFDVLEIPCLQFSSTKLTKENRQRILEIFRQTFASIKLKE